jgi:Uma2 family endonuclease
VAVVRGSARDFREAHPSLPVLLVEVADEGLDFDRRYKGSLYARAGVEDYWVMNLVSRELEVHRDPVASAAALYGWEYRWVHSFGRRDCVAPLAAPSARIAVGDLLP